MIIFYQGDHHQWIVVDSPVWAVSKKFWSKKWKYCLQPSSNSAAGRSEIKCDITYIQDKFWVWKYWEIRNKYIQEVFHSPKNWSENICLIKVGSNENEEEWKKTRPAAADKARWKERTWMIWTDVITGCGYVIKMMMVMVMMMTIITTKSTPGWHLDGCDHRMWGRNRNLLLISSNRNSIKSLQICTRPTQKSFPLKTAASL